MLRLPSSVLPESATSPYRSGDERFDESLTARTVPGHVILKFGSRDEEGGGEWIDGAGLLGSLLPIRTQLAQGDLRALYLGWLRGIQKGSGPPGAPEPPIPPGLRSLSPSLVAFASFLEIDVDLMTAAAASVGLAPVDADPAAAVKWIAELPSLEKDALLLRLIKGNAVQAGMELRARFEGQRTASPPPKLPTFRTVRQLLDAVKSVRQARERETAMRAAEELARSERKERAARARRLDALSLKVPQTWDEVEALVSVTQRVAYAEAARLLVDQREIAVRNKEKPEFVRRLGVLCERHARKKAFIDLLTERGLRS